MHKKGLYEKYFKRPFDFTASLIAFVVLLPLLLFIAILIRLKLGSPIIFKQKRPGLNGKTFTLYKFRTMTERKDENGKLLSDKERLSGFGNFLRSTSMDELPEILNIIKGDMSIVGPRPLLIEYLKLYDEKQKKRHEVNPGLTGLAQISGRNKLSWEEKFDLDIQYLNNITFISDLKIILITFFKTIKREGINSGTSDSMELFKGSEKKHKNL